MLAFTRIVVSAMVLLAVYFFSYWIFFVHVVPESITWLATLLSLAASIWASRAVWRKFNAGDRGLLATAGSFAAIAGAIGFCGGFFGPMIFAPDANQGPLLGIFITGPLGIVAGAIGGLAYGLWRRAGETEVE